jgi:flagellar hook-associated protein 2
MSAITINGIVSGLDTSSIIDKLVAVEGNSKTLLSNQQKAQTAIVGAYTTMLGSIGALASQVSSLANTSSWATTTAASSSSTVTAATTAASKSATSLTFDVASVAAAQALISENTVSSTNASVASSGSLTLTSSDGSTKNIGVGTGTLSDVVSAINAAGVGITASAIQTSPGQYRLQVASQSTGAASQFSLSGINGFTSMKVLAAGSDASITVGKNTGTSIAYSITSPTNTFAGVADGLSFTVSKIEAGVTVSTAVDPTAVSDQIASIVTNANNLLASISANTAWDPATKTGGALLGDSTVRSLQQSILSIVSSANTPGLSVTSSGQLAYDPATFKTAFAANPASVMSAYGASSSFQATAGVTGTASYTNAISSTIAGSYAINVTSNAKAEKWQLVPPGTGIVGRLMTMTRGATTVSYTALASDTAASAADAFNTKLAQAKVGVSAAVDGFGAIVLSAANAGTSGSFTAAMDGGATATKLTAGTNIAGTIDGVAATGIGNLLSLSTTAESGAAGISIAVNASDADITASGGAIGTLSYKPGLAQQLDTLFSQMSDSTNGQLVTAQATATTQIKTLQTAIDSWTAQLDNYRATLNGKFTAMETALSALKAQSSAMSSFFGTTSSSSSSSTSASS